MQLTQSSIWGLTPVQLHDRFWASRGVQVVRQGEASEIVPPAELFLLTDARSLALFRLERPIEVLSWTKPQLLLVRLKDHRERGYREHALADAAGNFMGYQRLYGAADTRLARTALTRSRELARLWQLSDSPREGWRRLRREAGRLQRHVLSVSGSVYHRSIEQDLMEFSRRLVQIWHRPDATITRAVRRDSAVWLDAQTPVPSAARFVGPVWVGAGRSLEEEASIVGPRVLWDDPACRPDVESLRWERIEPTPLQERSIHPRRASSLNRISKRAFDILFAAAALLITLPLYPLVMLAIWLEDGTPFFFGHRRETMGGREFSCIKFRSMRKDAEQVKAQLASSNEADGPQFFMENDPRLTRVGRLLRDWNIDELPQFFNVLLGHMSVVGPRPSPKRENQFCPPWREARLSVRPGITGLWQVMRTRRRGTDFQEWIKYDIEYVETANWRLDLWIIFQTIRVLM